MKKQVVDNYRVEIRPRRKGDYGMFTITGEEFTPEEELRECQDLKQQVLRHVDYAGRVSIECDKKYVCSHCDALWTEDSDAYNGGCCAKDESNNPSERDK